MSNDFDFAEETDKLAKEFAAYDGPKEEFAFYDKTCAHCVYYYQTPGHQTWNVCRFWIPSSTAINQWAIFPHTGNPHTKEVLVACGCFKLNPFLKEESVAGNQTQTPSLGETG